MNVFDIIRGAKNTRRLASIAGILVKHGFAELADWLGLPGIVKRRSLEKVALSKAEPQGAPERFAQALEDMGPTFIKLGQLLSTRPDILPETWINALARLQDKIAPLDFDTIQNLIKSSQRDKNISDSFSSIESTPIAAASIAQVHRGVLKDGRRVVVKVRRPGVTQRIDDDLALLAWFASRIEERVPSLTVIRPREIVDEFARNLRRETDFLTEAAMLEKFNGLAEKHNVPLTTPRVVRELSSPGVLVMTELNGRSIRKWMADPEISAERKAAIADRVGRAFMAQFFELGIFHADPHPGNLLVDSDDTLSLLDFGSIGTLSRSLRNRMATALVALHHGDTELLTAVLLDIADGESMPDRAGLEMDITENLDRIYVAPGSRLDIAGVFQEVIMIARRHELRMPREFVMLNRSLWLVNALCIHLNPEMSMAEVAGPYAQRFVSQRFDAKNILSGSRTVLYNLQQAIVEAPLNVRSIAQSIRRGNLGLRIRVEEMARVVREINALSGHLAFSIITAAVFLASAALLAANARPWIGDIIGASEKAPSAPWRWSDISLFGFAGGILACLMAMRLVVSLFNSKIER